eukprot:TRINITY_DN3527_c0_g1_i15.p2 TRINITY_DN3527_c0_g1~~TRINITY_DN3527_c0_g1_i15.p2  ORF type:complete len:525 (+),score=157.67 TRINITY_DN3527_c0_g1_i15:1413-2987(+)
MEKERTLAVTKMHLILNKNLIKTLKYSLFSNLLIIIPYSTQPQTAPPNVVLPNIAPPNVTLSNIMLNLLFNNPYNKYPNNNHLKKNHLNNNHLNDNHLNDNHLKNNHLNHNHLNHNHLNHNHLNRNHLNRNHLNHNTITSTTITSTTITSTAITSTPQSHQQIQNQSFPNEPLQQQLFQSSPPFQQSEQQQQQQQQHQQQQHQQQLQYEQQQDQPIQSYITFSEKEEKETEPEEGPSTNPLSHSFDGSINPSELEYLKQLSVGASGDIYKGLYKGCEVAIKVIRQIGSRPKEELDKEFKMLCLVTSSHVVKCFGACLSSQLTCIVMELCSRDTLYSVLNKEGIKWSFGIQACIEAVTGLRTLHVHQPPILHRDLKSLNLLVTEDWHIKLCDFGLSQFEIPQNFETLKEVCGTFAYSDPQVFNGNPFSIASDIYSMGIIFWEISQTIVMGRYSQPYSEYKNISFDFQILIRVATQNLRPTFSPQTPQKFQILTEKMLHNLQQERPGSLDILEVLETIKESGEVEG